jgi:hypothetical protein
MDRVLSVAFRLEHLLKALVAAYLKISSTVEHLLLSINISTSTQPSTFSRFDFICCCPSNHASKTECASHTPVYQLLCNPSPPWRSSTFNTSQPCSPYLFMLQHVSVRGEARGARGVKLREATRSFWCRSDDGLWWMVDGTCHVLDRRICASVYNHSLKSNQLCLAPRHTFLAKA